MDCTKLVAAHFIEGSTYTLMVDVNPGDGAIEINSAAPPSYPDTSPFEYGTPVTLEAVPPPGYIFANWSGDLSGSENPITITMDSNMEVTANFAQTTYTLTVDVGPGDGDIEVDGGIPSSYPDHYTFAPGASVELEAVAASGYEFANWDGNLSGSENPTIITMDPDMVVTASFVPSSHFLTVDVGPNGGGSVSLEPFQHAEGYSAGAEVILIAAASEGYEFVDWSGALSDSENPITIIMDSDKGITANFSEVAPSPFPWWWIVVGVGIVGLLVYFLVLRKTVSSVKVSPRSSIKS
jgi:hypothetical protein